MQAQQVKITYSGNKAKVAISNKALVSASVHGADVELESRLTDQTLNVLVTGTSEEGSLMVKADEKVRIQLKNLTLTSKEGAALWLKTKKSVEIEAMKGTTNSLTVTACRDTAHHKSAVIWSKGKLHFTGKGTLNLLATGDGCKGINGKKDITMEDLTLSVITEGNNLGKKEGGWPGGPGGPGFPGGPEGPGFQGVPGPPMGPAPDFNFDQLPDSVKAFFEKMRKQFEEGGGMPPYGGSGGPGFPGGPEFQGGPEGPGFPPFGGGPFGPGMESGDPDEEHHGAFKQRYVSTTKGIKSRKQIRIKSGDIYVKTSSQGAEGIEGKEGIEIKGGKVRVDAIDDALNANAPILVSGGSIIAESHCNDAVDVNMEGGFPMPFGPQTKDAAPLKPAIIIAGGKVYAWSHTGSPEEGLDCDFAPLAVDGGEIFTIGGGMGEMPSVPTQQTAQQPTLLFVGLNLFKGDKVEIMEGDKALLSLDVPFSFRNSASIITCPQLQFGHSYTLRTNDEQRSFTLTDHFTVVRK